MTPDYFAAALKIFLGPAESPMQMDTQNQFTEVKILHHIPGLLHYIDLEIGSIVKYHS
jgi:hypothetical protein